MSPIEDLEQRLVAALRNASPEQRMLAVEVTADIAQLAARKALGEDVDAEIGHAAAAAQNLEAGVAVTAAHITTSWIVDVLGNLLTSALPLP